jgi:hypothetical protein
MMSKRQGARDIRTFCTLHQNYCSNCSPILTSLSLPLHHVSINDANNSFGYKANDTMFAKHRFRKEVGARYDGLI